MALPVFVENSYPVVTVIMMYSTLSTFTSLIAVQKLLIITNIQDLQTKFHGR